MKLEEAAAILGIEFGSKFSEETLRTQYRIAAQNTHQDAGGEDSRFELVREAKTMLEPFQTGENGLCSACSGTGKMKKTKGFKTITTTCPWCKELKPF